MNWYAALWRRHARRHKRITLLVMHQDDMWIAHPETAWDQTCDHCNGPVGIYPSGQHLIAQHSRAKVIITCNRCTAIGIDAVPLPGALSEVGHGKLIRRMRK